MSSEIVERAFEPYYTTKGEHGAGLGRATIYGIVRDLGGTVHVDSRPGVGTSVVVHLPLSDSTGEAPA